MIDLADPSIDVEGLFKKYINYENENFGNVWFGHFFKFFEDCHPEFLNNKTYHTYGREKMK